MSRWSVCWRKIKKKPRRILAQSPCVLQIFHVICHYLRFSIINLISVAWTSLERERGECRFPCSFMFSVYWLIQRQYWIIHIACFPIFFSSGTSKREKKYFILQLICVSLRIKPRGMEPQWSPCKAFSDRHRNHSSLKRFIFDHLTEALRENWKDLIFWV